MDCLILTQKQLLRMTVKTTKLKKVSIYLMALAYMGVGITHFTQTDFFVAIVPSYLKWPLALVYISGFFEILLGLGLLTSYRKWAAWGLIFLLVAVFPANIFLAFNTEAQVALDISKTAAIIRLPFQLVFLGLAYWHSKP